MAASDNLRLQVILSAVDRVTGPFKKIMGGSRGVAGALRQQRDALRQLNAQQRDIGAYREQVAVARQAQVALDNQRAAVRELARQMRATDAPSQKLVASFEKARKVGRELKTVHGQQEAALQRVRKRLEATGISTRELVAHERRLRGEISATTAAMQASQAQLARLDAAQKRAGRMHRGGMSAAAHGAGALYAGQRALRAQMLPLGQAMNFESAMADVRKVVDFESPAQFEQMGRDIEDLSMRLPMVPTEIAAIVAAAGQAGIAREDLKRFAEDAVKMGVAFDTTAEESGQTMATWRTAFRMSQDQVVVLADKINYLGNTGPASVAKISDVVNRIGALGEVAGLGSGPLAALGATVAGMGIQAEVSATGIKNMLLTLSSGEAATKRQHTAFKALGIDAVEMAKLMQRDANGAILKVLERLQALPKAAQAATMTRLFGRESIGAIAPLLTNLALLKENFAKVADMQQYGGSMSAEYAARVATSANTLQLAKNTALVMSQSIGRTLIPDFKALAERVAAVVKRVTDWIRDNAKLVATLARTVIAGTALVTVLGGLLIAGGTAAMAFSQIHKAVMLLSGGNGLGALARQLLGIGGRLLPMLLNTGRVLLPLLGGISLPVLAIGAAVAVAAALVWKYWEPIKAFLLGMWQGLREAFDPVLAALRTALAPLAPVWKALSAATGTAWQWLRQLFAPLQATGEQLAGATSAGRSFGQVIGAVLSFQLRAAVSAIGWLVQAFGAVLPTVQRVLGGVWQYAQGAWSLIVGVFTLNGGRIRDGLAQLWTGINAILAGWPARLLQAGMAMIDGLVQGIHARIGAAVAAVAGVGGGVIGAFKGMLGIHSPSRVFAQLGGFTMQGLTEGLLAARGAPVAAVAAVGARMAAAGVGATLAVAAPPSSAIDRRPPLQAAGHAGVSAQSGGDHYEINIHAAPGMDPRQVALAVRRELEAIAREKSARGRSRLRDD